MRHPDQKKSSLPVGFAMRCLQDSKAASTIQKHAGRAFGAISLANLAVRNGLMMWALEMEVPLDKMVRLHDTLAALPLCEVYSINQVDLERTIEAMAEAKVANEGLAPAAKLPEVAFAVKRLLTGLSSYTPTTGENLWELAASAGIPLTVQRKSPWGAARQMLFSRKRKRSPELAQFGGSEAGPAQFFQQRKV